MEDFARYLQLVRDKWPLVIPAGATIVLAIVTVALGSKHPLLLSATAWLALAAICLIVAQFLVWRDSRVDTVEDPHATRLRAIAEKLQIRAKGGATLVYTDGRSGAAILREMFAAHFPTELGLATEYDSAKHRERRAEESLRKLVEQQARERFPQDLGWSADALIQRCCLEVGQLAKSHGDAPVALDGAAPRLVWRTAVLRNQAGPDQKAEVEAWVREVFNSEAAEDYRAAEQEAALMREAVVDGLDPIIHDVPILKAPSCRVCFPRET